MLQPMITSVVQMRISVIIPFCRLHTSIMRQIISFGVTDIFLYSTIFIFMFSIDGINLLSNPPFNMLGKFVVIQKALQSFLSPFSSWGI